MINILWIDDDEQLIDSSIPVFLRNGFYIFKATNVSESLRLLREESERIDGVLLDVRLQGNENGLELLRELLFQYPRLRIVVFTGYPEYDDHVLAQRLGASTYFEKIEKSIPLDAEKQHRFFQALHHLFPKKTEEIASRGHSQSRTPQLNTSLWITGLFFLLMFVLIVFGLAVLSRLVSPWVLPIVLVATILCYLVVGAFILRIQGGQVLSQSNFMNLAFETLRYLPTISKRPDSLPAQSGESKTELTNKENAE